MLRLHSCALCPQTPPGPSPARSAGPDAEEASIDVVNIHQKVQTQREGKGRNALVPHTAGLGAERGGGRFTGDKGSPESSDREQPPPTP